MEHCASNPRKTIQKGKWRKSMESESPGRASQSISPSHNR